MSGTAARVPVDAPPAPIPNEQLLVPARMVNEFVYCPRLAYLEWVQGEWGESADTVEGRHRHRRVDAPAGELPDPAEGDGERLHARSVTLSSERLGVVCKIDLVEAEGGEATPVDYKRGKRPHVAGGAYDPERVQLCLQGFLLEENGYTSRDGVLYYCGSRERVGIPFDEALRAQTLAAVEGLRALAARGEMPPPLEDSPKCPRCSLAPICLPDEVNLLANGAEPPRPLAVGKAEALPLYVQARGAKLAKRGEVLEITTQEDEPPARARLIDVSQVVLVGGPYVTTPCLQELMRRGIPVSWHTHGGWFLGHTVGTGHKNVELRTAQYRASFDPAFCLRFARKLVWAKARNARTLLRRNWRGGETPEEALASLKRLAERALRAGDAGELLGIEGAAAAAYFGAFGGMLKEAESGGFDFTKRNRRPPADPVNALLSFAYAMLVRAFTMTLSAVGFDPYRGLYHQPRYGRPALALDLMESFRPLIAESCVLQAVNNGEVGADDFFRANGACALRPEGRKRLIAAFERRMDHEVTHPLFGYRVSYRRLIEVQARLLGRHLLDEIPEYPHFLTR